MSVFNVITIGRCVIADNAIERVVQTRVALQGCCITWWADLLYLHSYGLHSNDWKR